MLAPYPFNISFSSRGIQEILDDEDFVYLMTVNAETIFHCNDNISFRECCMQSENVFDGKIPLALRNFFYEGKADKISGSDLIFDILAKASRDGRKVFFLGGTGEANSRAKANILSEYQLEVDGFSPPFAPYPFSRSTNKRISELLMKSRPHYLIVNFDNLKSNLWIKDNLALLGELDVRFVSALGGTIDLLAGDLRRCPQILSGMGLEWLFRLVIQPRMFRLRRIWRSLKGLSFLVRKPK